MAFEQHWALEQCPRDDVIAAVLEVADRHALRFWAHSDDDAIAVWVQFPIEGASALACALSDLYTSPDEAAHELEAIDGAARYTCRFDIEWERDEPVGVYGSDEDNRAGWPLIVAFADAVATALGGSWVDP